MLTQIIELTLIGFLFFIAIGITLLYCEIIRARREAEKQKRLRRIKENEWAYLEKHRAEMEEWANSARG